MTFLPPLLLASAGVGGCVTCFRPNLLESDKESAIESKCPIEWDATMEGAGEGQSRNRLKWMLLTSESRAPERRAVDRMQMHSNVCCRRRRQWRRVLREIPETWCDGGGWRMEEAEILCDWPNGRGSGTLLMMNVMLGGIQFNCIQRLLAEEDVDVDEEEKPKETIWVLFANDWNLLEFGTIHCVSRGEQIYHEMSEKANKSGWKENCYNNYQATARNIYNLKGNL